MAHSSCLLGSQVQGLIFLALIESPEVFFLSLINDSEDTGSVFLGYSYLGELGEGWGCHLFSYTKLGQLHLQILIYYLH